MSLKLVAAAAALAMLAGCEVIGNIFQAGVWVGVILVVAIIAVIAFIVAKLR